jgi:hypothetical protein
VQKAEGQGFSPYGQGLMPLSKKINSIFINRFAGEVKEG